MKMTANRFYKSITEMDCVATCCGGWDEIEPILNNSIHANYNKIKALIKKLMPDLYENLAMKYYNPWSNQTYRSKDNQYIIITNSAIEYLIQVN
jgi:hypothetical protein